jgi:hypothetical protein
VELWSTWKERVTMNQLETFVRIVGISGGVIYLSLLTVTMWVAKLEGTALVYRADLLGSNVEVYLLPLIVICLAYELVKVLRK